MTKNNAITAKLAAIAVLNQFLRSDDIGGEEGGSEGDAIAEGGVGGGEGETTGWVKFLAEDWLRQMVAPKWTALVKNPW